MRRLGIHKNIPGSGTKLTLGLRVGFIGSHLTVDKLIPDNPRAITGPPNMSFLLEAKSVPALIIKPRFILGLMEPAPPSTPPRPDCHHQLPLVLPCHFTYVITVNITTATSV